MESQKIVDFLFLYFVFAALSLLTACSNQNSFELKQVAVKVYEHDKDHSGSTIDQKTGKHFYIYETVLRYEFMIENTSNDTIGSPNFSPTSSMYAEVQPNDEMLSVVKPTLFDNQEPFFLASQDKTPKTSSRLLSTGPWFLKPHEKGTFVMEFELGRRVDDGAPEDLSKSSPPPTTEQANVIQNEAWNAKLVLKMDNKELRSFDIKTFQK